YNSGMALAVAPWVLGSAARLARGDSHRMKRGAAGLGLAGALEVLAGEPVIALLTFLLAAGRVVAASTRGFVRPRLAGLGARLLHRGRTRRGPVAREVPAARQEDLPAAVARRPDPLPGEMVVRRGAVPGADGGLGGGAVAPGRTSQSVLARGRRRAAGRVPRRRPRLRRRHTARRGR